VMDGRSKSCALIEGESSDGDRSVSSRKLPCSKRNCPMRKKHSRGISSDELELSSEGVTTSIPDAPISDILTSTVDDDEERSRRHVGQLDVTRDSSESVPNNQISTQPRWKQCPQFRVRNSSPSTNDSKQMAHMGASAWLLSAAANLVLGISSSAFFAM